jgi:hypothetical protein
MGAGAFEADHRRTVLQDSNPSWKCMTGIVIPFCHSEVDRTHQGCLRDQLDCVDP